MNKLAVTITVLVMVILMVACSPSTTVVYHCTEYQYKKEAATQMGAVQGTLAKFNPSFDSVDEDLDAAISDMEGNLQAIRDMECADAFPLKQETLEYTAFHYIHWLERLKEGHFDAADSSSYKALINYERFINWSVDMEKGNQ